MSDLIKIAIPLINDNISLSDINEKTEFYNAYLYNKNKPFLDNHIFLLYKMNDWSEEKIKTFKKLKSINNFYGCFDFYKDGNLYKLFIFTSNKTINLLKEGKISLTDSQKIKVLKFWNFNDNLMYIRFMNNINYINPNTLEEIPEEDYLLGLDEQKMGSGITIDTTTH